MENNLNDFLISLLNNINFHILGKKTDSYDVLHMANLLSAVDSAQYLIDKMINSENHEDDLSLLRRAMQIRKRDGLILEFGVASGRTINHIASLTEHKVFGFDVFSGLPEDWRIGFPRGSFAQSRPEVRENVELVVGLFEETIPSFLRDASDQNISLLHVDCDLYSSTETIFRLLGPLISRGTVIVFDEYFNYPGWRQHEFKAFQEFVLENKLNYRYEAYVSKHQQVCVVIE